MNPTQAQLKNAEQAEKFAALLAEVLTRINDIDANTVADARWPNEPPEWWVAMSRLRDECHRAKARL